ncbi:TIGR04219 family outer membrane beta-barrel protein [Vibrio tubiashii]|uniref:TIGR04219 family outer membrane beta-barrel protein n=1 Tax=Vibrio tubiashii TaxID=29498 RepID=UPI001EFDAD24|nr:TIGR04219 family outer membrane beta-barrel protein [Vibrio tubiashii]MCG9584274.1 TIGR04219 family outer membrane beta-barrel protein [Vibrio tubiashii]MCG9617869.1 TIGR04219 family outer membrane beta-barrel protein [Vibrio tubiashii]MCG9689936.1 TIGR04219 family outer membrane beta-barrel protein [Vibrio tubiashii]
MGLKTAIALAAVVSTSALAESSLTTKFGAEMWFPKTEVNEVNRESDTTPSFYAAIEHDVKYVPDARVRYSTVDADYMAFNKLDLTLYYRILEHDLMHFDAGMTFSDLSNTKYVNADTNDVKNFDEMIWAWYGYAEITVPNTNLDVIGEMNFGNNSGIKSTDLIAGMQYRLPLGSSTLALRGGYRVIDLEAEGIFKPGEGSNLGKPFIFANGFFAGAEFSF